MDGGKFAARHDSSLMVIDQFNRVGFAAFPAETDAELVVDANAVLASRSPANFSRRLPGGTRRSFSDAAASKMRSFLNSRAGENVGACFRAHVGKAARSRRRGNYESCV